MIIRRWMPRVIAAVACVLVSGSLGCVFAGVPVVGYGSKRGVFAGGSVAAGIERGQVSIELDAVDNDLFGQYRLDFVASTPRTGGTVTEGSAYPGVRAGLGFSHFRGENQVAAVLGPDVTVLVGQSRCTDHYFGFSIEVRRVASEYQIAFAPRYEQLRDLCGK